MKKTILLGIAALGALFMQSCSKEDFMTFDDSKTGIYMQRIYTTTINGTPISFTDSAVVSFSNYKADVTELRLYVPVAIMGPVADHDRRFKLSVDESLSNAVKDEDYTFSDSACYIPAGKTSKTVYLKIKRTSKLEKAPVRLVFKLEDNENFTVELEKYNSNVNWASPGKELCGSRYKIIYSDIYDMPYQWDWYGADYWGTWSATKEKLLNQVMGWTHASWNDGTVKYGLMPYSAKQLKKYLQAQADAGTPVKDEDGSYMQLPNPYTVDYSKYGNQ